MRRGICPSVVIRCAHPKDARIQIVKQIFASPCLTGDFVANEMRMRQGQGDCAALHYRRVARPRLTATFHQPWFNKQRALFAGDDRPGHGLRSAGAGLEKSHEAPARLM
jgi:hypothetical protein